MKNSRIPGQHLYEWSVDLQKQLNCTALCLPDGTAFHLSPTHLTDTALLPFATEIVSKYFKPHDGDVFVVNDPYGGGSDLSQMTLVGVLEAGKYFAVKRVANPTRLALTSSLHEEGLRIPPTPLLFQGKLNHEILEVMGGHPMAAPGFARNISAAVQEFHDALKRSASAPRFKSTKPDPDLIRDILANLLSQFRERLCDITLAESTEDALLADLSRVRLRTVVKKGEILFDFSGTTPVGSFAMTDRAIAGVCLSSLLSAIDWRGPVHSRLFDCLKIQTPAGSCVNARFPQSLGLGYRDGAFLISNLVLKTLQQIDATLTFPQTSPIHCAYALKFQNGSEFFDTLEPGLPASIHQFGLAADQEPAPLNTPHSIEECETKFPLRFMLVGFRKNSGGHGEREGGMGKTKVIEVREAAKLVWQFLPYDRRPEGTRGGKAGAQPEIGIVRAGQHEVLHLGFAGEEALAAGDRVIVQSAGGGGYGETATESEGT